MSDDGATGSRTPVTDGPTTDGPPAEGTGRPPSGRPASGPAGSAEADRSAERAADRAPQDRTEPPGSRRLGTAPESASGGEPGPGTRPRAEPAGAPTTVLPAGGGRPPRPAAGRGDRGPADRRSDRGPADRRSDRGQGERPPPSRGAGRRRARLAVQRLDPWSVFLFSLVASLCLGVVSLVAVAALYAAMSSLGVIGSLNGLLGEVAGTGADTEVVDPFITANRVLGATAVLAAINVVLLTALATLGGLIYNLCASLTGGIEVQLGERE